MSAFLQVEDYKRSVYRGVWVIFQALLTMVPGIRQRHTAG